MTNQMTDKMFDIQDIQQNFIQPAHVDKIYGLPVDTTIAFSNHRGIYKKRIERQQRKLLQKLEFLAPFLSSSERILFVTLGFSHASFVEQLLTGLLLHPLKRSLFVVTSRRILQMPTTHHLSYRGSISQIMFVDCRQIRVRFSTLTARYKSGRCEKFRCIGRRGRKKIRAILRDMSLDGKASPALERANLCPRCTKPLIKGYYACPNCSLPFKTKAKAMLLSMLIPGGGYFYTRHPFLGIFQAAMEILFMFLLIISSIVFWKNYSQDPRSLGQAVVISAIILVYEKLATALFSSKCAEDFIPKARHVEVQIEKVRADRAAPSPDDMLATGWRSR